MNEESELVSLTHIMAQVRNKLSSIRDSVALGFSLKIIVYKNIVMVFVLWRPESERGRYNREIETRA